MAQEFLFESNRQVMSLYPAPKDDDAQPGMGGTDGTSGYEPTTSGVAITTYETGNNNGVGLNNMVGNLSTGIGNYNQIQSEMVVISGKRNLTGKDIQNSIIVGNNNIISNGVLNSGILGGDNNTIESDVKNSWLINSNLRYIDTDNTIIIGDVIEIKNGVYRFLYNIVEGGGDYVVPLRTSNNYDIIDGGTNGVFKLFPEDFHDMLDGGIDNIFGEELPEN